MRVVPEMTELREKEVKSELEVLKELPVRLVHQVFISIQKKLMTIQAKIFFRISK